MKYARSKERFSGITKNKMYKILNRKGRGFTIIKDNGNRAYCLPTGCAHLRGGDWELFEEYPGNENSPNIKDTNPKDAVGTKKAPMSTVSAPVMMAVGLAMLEGSRKYGRHNYRISGVRASVYYDAAMRHLMAWWEGEDCDSDSGLSHVIKAIACLTVLADADMNGKVLDDRPPKSIGGWMQKMNIGAEEIIERYPDALEAYTEQDN